MTVHVDQKTFTHETAPYTLPEQFYAACAKPSDELAYMVSQALRFGYGLDTADINGNLECIDDGIAGAERIGVDPDEIVVTLKVWPSDFGREQTIAAILRMRESLRKARGLGVRFTGVLQWPGKDMHRMASAYNGLEACVHDGLLDQTGVANFDGTHLRALHSSDIEIRPSLLQVEHSPFYAPPLELLIACDQTWKYPVMALGVFGGRKLAQTILQHPTLKHVTGMGLQLRHDGELVVLHSPQTILAYLMSRGLIPVSSTMNPEHLRMNALAPLVQLTDVHREYINTLSGYGMRSTRRPSDFDPRLPSAILRTARRRGIQWDVSRAA